MTHQLLTRTHFWWVWVSCLGLITLVPSLQAQRWPDAYWRRESASRVHDPSTIVREGGTYWMFSTGNGIKSAFSTNLRDWRPGARVLLQMPEWVREVRPNRRGNYWAPDITRVGDRWFLYYSVSSFGTNNSAIALASTPSLTPTNSAYHWRDDGIVIRSFGTNDFNAIDPAVFKDADDRLWLAFGSYWSGIRLIELDRVNGKRINPDSPIHSLAWNDRIEAPFLYRRGTNYYLFVNWGECCKGASSTYEIRVGRSDKVTGPYLDRDGKAMLAGGGTKVVGSAGRFIGPGHAGIVNDGAQDWFSFHFYDGNSRGRATVGMRRLLWDEAGWPQVGGSNPD